MIKLIEPSDRYLKSYIEAYDEYRDRCITNYSFGDARNNDIFVKYDEYRNEYNLKSNRVGADYFWLVDDDNALFIGEISIRHRLTEELLKYGGHIGYAIRYSEWNKGYGTLMLSLALEKAKDMGIQKILITCDEDNYASAKVMENNDMTFTDKVENVINGYKVITKRYWKILD